MARPAKHLLLIDSNENTRSILGYLFYVHRYLVSWAATPNNLTTDGYDLVIGVWPIEDSFTDLAEHAGVPSLLICEHLSQIPDTIKASNVLVQPACSPQDVLEAVKAMTARKRGPRKGWKEAA